MPTQQVICRKEKAVVVRVYVEKPRKKKVPSNHHHIHHTFREVVHDKGYDRRAELLRYSQSLRNSARSTPSLSKQLSNNVHGKLTTKAVPSQSKQKHEGKHWNLWIPSFLRSSVSANPKEKKKKNHMHSGLFVNQITNVVEKIRGAKKKRLLC